MRIRTLRCPAILVTCSVMFFAAYASAATATVSFEPGYEVGSNKLSMPTYSPGGGNTQLSTPGGPFIGTVQSGTLGNYSAGGNSAFVTFCVEVNEHIDYGTTYDGVVSAQSVFGEGSTRLNSGTNQYGSSGYVALTAQVAYLYATYMSGSTAMSNAASSAGGTWNGNSDLASVQSLQNAIWYFMGYASYQYGGSSSLTTALENAANTATGTGTGNTWTQQWGRTLDGSGNDVSIGNVRVLQLWLQGEVGTDAGKSQDQLILVPTPSASMAGVGLLGSLCLAGLVKRRRRNQIVLD